MKKNIGMEIKVKNEKRKNRGNMQVILGEILNL